MKHTCLKELLDDAAEAIREHDGTTAEIIGDDIPDRIRALPTKGEPYTGAYVVHPKTTSQELNTKDHHMTDNVTVDAIYYSETSNLSGITVFIGEN